ncbi:5,6-dimethylbenzimidazole synthase [Oleispirillum naphthae]|uniref:5,6-dimethylbenzimidazole synthase n=1 Tax=Oleispirillum naphthae TaxID=2838853 RepID=UPI00308262BD
MAGTDPSREQSPTVENGAAPKVILVRPQLAENIGMVARAMLNCGLAGMRLVEPQEPPSDPRARASASGADVVLERAELFPDVRAAIADAHWVVATTARRREQVKPVMTPRAAAAEMRGRIKAGQKVAVLFGPERTGLTNDEVSLADAVCEVPLNPAYCSLNLAQAVLLVGYEWFQAGVDVPPCELVMNETAPAAKDEVLNFYAHLERELELCGFLRVEDKRPSMVRNIRALFNRAGLTEQDVRTLHGMVAELAHGSLRRARKLGIPVDKLRAAPQPLYTSRPLFDSAFADKLTELFIWRRDVRRFTTEPVPGAAVTELLELACLAPSVGNSQPWRFVLVEGGERRAAIRSNFEAANAAALAGYDGDHAQTYATLKLSGLDRAPVQIAVFADPDPAEGHGLGRQTMPETLHYSVIAAVQTLWLAARARGLGVGMVSILDPETAKAACDVPETWDLVAYLCLGHPEEEHADPELVRAGWQDRIPMDRVVFRR